MYSTRSRRRANSVFLPWISGKRWTDSATEVELIIPSNRFKVLVLFAINASPLNLHQKVWSCAFSVSSRWWSPCRCFARIIASATSSPDFSVFTRSIQVARRFHRCCGNGQIPPHRPHLRQNLRTHTLRQTETVAVRLVRRHGRFAPPGTARQSSRPSTVPKKSVLLRWQHQ